MPATSPRFDDALEIAVCDLPVSDEVEREATVSLLPVSREPVHTDVHAILEVDDDEVDEVDESGEWMAEDEVLLEPSDVLDVETARDACRGFGDAPKHPPQNASHSGGPPGPTCDPSGRQSGDEFCGGDGEAPKHPPQDASRATAGEVAATTLVDTVVEDELAETDPEPEASERAPVDPIRVPLWSGLNSFAYALSRGLRGMAQAPLVQLIAVGTMAVCMLLLGTTTLILQNAQRVASDLGVDTPVTVYMQPEVDADTLAQLQTRVTDLPEVASVEHVTPEMALARLQEGLGEGDSIASVGDSERAELLAGIDASNLPDTLEIGLVAGVQPGFADALAGRITDMDGVEEVSALGPWVQDVERMLTTLRWLAFGVAALVSLACLAIVWNTIRLGVFARRSEIEILRLVGGTGRFVRGPFVVEGVLQGVLGTALAIACLWLSFELIRPFLERGMALMFAAGSLRFFSMIELGVALGFGAVLGLIGSRAAVARHA